jgi:hypothetical protein
MDVKNPFQLPRLAEIRAGKKFWGYLDTEALQCRYVLAAHFLKRAKNIVEIGGYRGNVITNFLTGAHDSVTVYSLDAEFEPLERCCLNGSPCRVRHVMDYFQEYPHEGDSLGVVALGLEVIGDPRPLYELIRKAQIAILEVPVDHPPSVDCLQAILAKGESRLRCQINLDLTPNALILHQELRATNMNAPFWRRNLYVLEPLGVAGT